VYSANLNLYSPAFLNETRAIADQSRLLKHREDHGLAQQQIDRALLPGQGFDFEHRLQLPDGSVKHVRVTTHPSRDSAGNLEFVGAVTDVSKQHHAEAMIQEREREFARKHSEA
jgi:PAS domain S-box-containing protein